MPKTKANQTRHWDILATGRSHGIIPSHFGVEDHWWSGLSSSCQWKVKMKTIKHETLEVFKHCRVSVSSISHWSLVIESQHQPRCNILPMLLIVLWLGYCAGPHCYDLLLFFKAICMPNSGYHKQYACFCIALNGPPPGNCLCMSLFLWRSVISTKIVNTWDSAVCSDLKSKHAKNYLIIAIKQHKLMVTKHGE